MLIERSELNQLSIFIANSLESEEKMFLARVDLIIAILCVVNGNLIFEYSFEL